MPKLKVHVEGMGLTGSLLAWWLECWGLDWTWHDIDAPVTAWKASTGAIFPAGNSTSLDWQTFCAWEAWLGGGKSPYPLRHFERAEYWYSQLTAPHSGNYKPGQESKHGLRRAPRMSWHLNAQSFVPATRKEFANRRKMRTESCDRYIVAHGFGRRLHHVVWGWTVPVQLRYDRSVYGKISRPCFYFREGRFVMAYAYPIARTDTWYAGSSLIHQKAATALDIEPKYQRWLENFTRLSGGAVKVKRVGEPKEGWRPAEAEPHAVPKVQRKGRVLSVPPLWHSGIRHFPEVLRQLEDHLQ